jgi:hypothetical protein
MINMTKREDQTREFVDRASSQASFLDNDIENSIGKRIV